jgi:hypothetical protein
MKRFLSFAGLLVLMSMSPAQAAEKAKKGAQPADAARQEMMAKWMAAATPGEPHRVLDGLMGSWDYTMQWWMGPDAMPEQSTGSVDARWILGGRFLQQNTKGFAMGQPFEGILTVGYNNLKKEYESVWIDNMATAMMKSTGKYDPVAKTITDTGLMIDCQDGKEKVVRSVTTFIDKDHYNFEMFVPGPDGKEYRSMKAVYTRKAQ